MSDKKTVPERWEPTTEPVSRAETRVISRGSAKSAELEPRMVLARRTLAAFVIDHQSAPLKFKNDFNLGDIGMLKTSEIQNLSLVDDNSVASQTFIVSFEYRGRESVSHVCRSDAIYRKLRKTLFDHGLAFKSATGATVNKLSIEPIVPAALTVSADLALGIVTLTLRNILMLGTTKYELAGERMDRPFIDSLTGLISGQANAFYALAAKTSKQIKG
ncbi:MAG: hypothetical protein O7G83_15220 [Proteobacteria bacterium]|nr:hypothetical protein [Pseudomonadota bacterium]